jgi:restriction system protein
MPRRNESLVDLLLKSPWWVSAVLGLIVFFLLRFAPVIWPGHDTVSQAFPEAISHASPLPLVLFGMVAIASFFSGLTRRRLVDRQNSLESLRATPWKEFEFLVAEAFRRQGYAVEYSLGRGADGGVDLVLKKDGRTSLVQCKQWKVYSVGPSVVREMFGLMTAENADEAIVVTTGRFTADAQRFANGKSIRLIDGPQFLVLVQSVQTGPRATAKESVTAAPEIVAAVAPACPKCGKPMVIRTARRGRNAGGQFWGCEDYPTCTGIR